MPASPYDPSDSDYWFQMSDEDALAREISHALAARMESPDHVWAYHPQSNSLGKTIARFVLARILNAEPGLQELAHSDRLSAHFGCPVSAGRRTHTVDLCIKSLGESEPEPTPRLIVEVKSCMTGHQKARSRLLSELHSTLDIAKAIEPQSIAIGVLVFNLSERFLSPLNLPNHNLHDIPLSMNILTRLLGEVDVGQPDGYDEFLVLPIDFDNDAVVGPLIGSMRPSGLPPSGKPLTRVARQLLDRCLEKSTEG